MTFGWLLLEKPVKQYVELARPLNNCYSYGGGQQIGDASSNREHSSVPAGWGMHEIICPLSLMTTHSWTSPSGQFGISGTESFGVDPGRYMLLIKLGHVSSLPVQVGRLQFSSEPCVVGQGFDGEDDPLHAGRTGGGGGGG